MNAVPVAAPTEILGRWSGKKASAAHARDYSWLIGELHYVYVRDVWRLRYASADDEDPFGGSVTLTGVGPMTAYRSGQRVRVEGHVHDPQSGEPSPVYCVHSIQSLPSP